MSQEEEERKSRIVIEKMVMVNFKSYFGRHEIGPFHKVTLFFSLFQYPSFFFNTYTKKSFTHRL